MNNLRIRLILSHIALILLIIPLLGITLIYFLETRVVLANLSTQLARQAGLLADFSADYPAVWQDQSAAQAFVQRFGDRTTAQIMLVDDAGYLLASSDPLDRQLLGQTLPNHSLEGVRGGQTVERTDYSQNLRAEVADIWAPVFDANGELVGAVRLTHQLVNVRERFQRLRTVISAVLALGLGLGGLTALMLATSLERPIGHFSNAMYRMATGDSLQPVPEQGPAELRTLAAAFNALVERLTTLRAARRQLMANLVHELGRPLGALRSASQALLDGAQEEPELRQTLLGGIDAELATLQRVLDDLTHFYQHDLGRLELELHPLPLGRWLRTVLAHWAESARGRALEWTADIPGDLPTVAVDPDRLGQALGNLLSNAIKFTEPGGKVSVAAGVTAQQIWIAVQDSGKGISPEDRSRIFEPFFRSRRHERLPQGMGLGLTIARDLVTAHGGRLEVDSAPGDGSRFTIWLPR